MKSFLFSLTILFLMIYVPGVQAQFEGEVIYDVYAPNSQAGENVNISVAFSEDRIFVDSNISMNVIAGLQARGVLVRNDRKDFVIFTRDNEGLQVEKSDLDNLVAMMNQMKGTPVKGDGDSFPWDEKVSETGRTQNLHGYETYEFTLEGDNEDEYVSVWLTDEIKVHWGLLLEAWYSTGAMQFEEEIPIEMIMNSNSFPLLVEVYRDNELVYKAESISVETPLQNSSKTSVPEGIKLIGLTDLMMNFFRQQ